MDEPNLNVTTAKVADLVPYANNAKKHPDSQVEQIARSIEEFGNCDPIAIWHNADGEPEVVEGHGRLLALKLLGIEDAPVIALDHLTDEKRRAYTHVHNQLTMNTDFDYSVLGADMAAVDFDWGAFGFDWIGAEDFGTDFELPDGDAPAFKSMSVQLTADQYALVSAALDSIDRGECAYRGGNENGDKVCEVVRQWAER